jgi:hypothetical protein
VVRDLVRLRERFERQAEPARLATIASELLRLSSWVRTRRPDHDVTDAIREIAWLMEWTGDAANRTVADMQRELCRWRRAWAAEVARPVLELRARQMAERLIELSGLGPQDADEAVGFEVGA